VDHHYLPQFYLREWCDSDGKVVRYWHTPKGRLDDVLGHRKLTHLGQQKLTHPAALAAVLGRVASGN
jgi:hypothetical protein